MFQVEWDQDALDELATLWTKANPDERQALTAASHTIDQRLKTDPRSEGESRAEDRRVMFVPPLVVIFQIEDDSQTALVLHVRMFRRRPG
jgi:ParE toxin of type II toxin-antitoxin system, parDE